MKIVEVEVMIGLTINTGDYSSLRVNEQIKVEVEEGEKPSKVIDRSVEYVDSKLLKDVEKIIRRHQHVNFS